MYTRFSLPEQTCVKAAPPLTCGSLFPVRGCLSLLRSGQRCRSSISWLLSYTFNTLPSFIRVWSLWKPVSSPFPAVCLGEVIITLYQRLFSLTARHKELFLFTSVHVSSVNCCLYISKAAE